MQAHGRVASLHEGCMYACTCAGGGGGAYVNMRVNMVVRVIGRLYPYASLWACCVFAWGCTYVGVGEGVHVWGVRVGGCVCVCMHVC